MEKKFYLGLDVGGTKVEGAIALLDESSHSIAVLAKKRIACIQEVTPFMESLVQLIQDLLTEAALSLTDLRAIGIGLPGTIHPKTKIMLNGNTQFLIGVEVLNTLQQKLNTDIPIVVQNDANLFALAEAWGGAGKHYAMARGVPFSEQIVIGVTLGTGVGGGFVSKGQILNGAHGSALEVGHIVLHSGGNKCYCGQQGCSETYLSGTAINKKMDSKVLFEKANKGEADVLQTMIDYRIDLVQFLSILNNLFNPHYIVFGGGLSAQKVLFEDLKTDLEENIFLSKEYCPDIYINHLGDSAGLFGAMIYANEILS
ncbi:ROK family protein [Bacteriovorax sp. PP10]|uniref:ROK family protein n=1 Tax=Bacteriovorax antarcticus TaxID=3088717 RepID=A0ABU5VWN5_9BACT|nr:ROK family protein [Bacteriovorax sp. PP10]MEA9357469.1 ROK family protein [Bacteriovorax sp. PP10]